MDDYDVMKWKLRLCRAVNTLYCSGALAAIVFAVLWLMTMLSGCASAAGGEQATSSPASRSLAEEIAFVTEEMRRAGCWAKDVDVTYSGPSGYVISAHGPYFEKTGAEKGGDDGRSR